MHIEALYVITKLVERCNLNCTYCYYYTPDNASVFDRAPVMGMDTLDQLLEYIGTAVKDVPIPQVVFGFHGGEPTLAKAGRVQEFCSKARAKLESSVDVKFVVQTNGVHLSEDWLRLIKQERMGVGISVDGTKDEHDRFRVDHRGRGSYDRVCATLKKLRPIAEDGHIKLTALAVMSQEFRGVEFYKHVVDDLGFLALKPLFPDRTCEVQLPRDELERLGSELCELFDYWLLHGSRTVEVVLFTSIVRALLTEKLSDKEGAERITLGFALLSDGSIRIQDDYMVARDWFWSQRDLNVGTSRFLDYIEQPHHIELAQSTLRAPEACRGCRFANSCRGGEVAHRYTTTETFKNKSVYCDALLMLHSHIERRLDLGERQIAQSDKRVEIEVA
ncbi:radical SAM protein [Silanimonas sp.]|uniref:radical SAM protein n=1 Tax=Silanimonas sp. TaxID=1929290 RepID=UPI001BB8967A|nr:radical SAM protein [Silanimonas sp.]MBS3895273.1 radical SAM protein [Silanimonas sp.]